MIRDQLIADGIPGPTEGRQWRISTIKGILTNEKYCGDALGQKTFKENLIGRKTVKNARQLPQVLVQKLLNLENIPVFDLGGRTVSWTLVPGHTPGSVVFLDE